jgi:transposase InsO family protein
LEEGGEYLVRGHIVGDKAALRLIRDGVFYPCQWKLEKRNIMAAHAIIDCQQIFCPVRLMNIGNQDVRLYKGMVLGEVEELCKGQKRLCQLKDNSVTQTNLLKLFEKRRECLPLEDRKRLEQILHDFNDVFSKSKFDIGVARNTKHNIDTGDAPPISSNPRRVPIGIEEKVDQLVDQLLDHEIIRPSCSPWNSPIVVVAKKDGDIRMCVDYRRLNSVTKRPIFPIPEPQHLFDTLSGAGYFSTLDLSQGYHQVQVSEEDIPKTAFTTRKGQFEYLRMPFGLCSAPATFQRLMHSVLRNENWEKCLIYLDDILVFGNTPEEHYQRLRAVLQRIREAGLKLSPSKCHLFEDQVEYLGHIISKSGISTSPQKIEKVKSWPSPTSQEELRSFLGLSGYYRRFIQNYAEIVAPLEKLCLDGWNKARKLRGKLRTWQWNSEHEEIFQHLKWCLTHSPILSFPAKDGDYILDTDASHSSIGAVLSQIQDGNERVIAYASNKLTKCEKGYCITRKELLAVYKYVTAFKHYLYGRKFIVRTDHQALLWLLNWKKPNTSQYCTWIAELECYDMEVRHRPGHIHTNADALSRAPQCEQCALKHEDPKKRRHVKVFSDPNEQEQEKVICKLSNMSASWNQEEDESLRVILDLLKKGKLNEKSPMELNKATEVSKMLWSRKKNLTIRGGLLYYTLPSGNHVLLVPQNRRKQLVLSMHQVLGHTGISKTAAAIKNDYFWPVMDQEIRLIINTCKLCQQRKTGNQGLQPAMQRTFTTYPFEKIAIDITGPLPSTRNGYRYILGVIDYFSKFVMLIPLRVTDSQTIADALFKRWICLFGAPISIHSDRGSCFESALFHELCQITGIVKTRTAPYYPQSDGLVERLFRTVKDMLFSTMRSFNKEWVDVLPLVELGLRGTVQASTKVSPFEILFSKSMRLPNIWMNPMSIDNFNKNFVGDRRCYSQYILDLQENLAKVHSDVIHSHLHQSPPSQASVAKRIVNSFAIGYHVMAKILPVEKGLTNPRYDGPYVIVNKLGPWTYELEHTITKKTIIRNHHHVKKCATQLVAEAKKPQTITSNAPRLSSTGDTCKFSHVPEQMSRQRFPPERFGFVRRGEVLYN